MAIGSWRQMPPGRKATRRKPSKNQRKPDPPGFPILTGFTDSQKEALKQSTNNIYDYVSMFPSSDNNPANGGAGSSVFDRVAAGAQRVVQKVSK